MSLIKKISSVNYTIDDPIDKLNTKILLFIT